MLISVLVSDELWLFVSNSELWFWVRYVVCRLIVCLRYLVFSLIDRLCVRIGEMFLICLGWLCFS